MYKDKWKSTHIGPTFVIGQKDYEFGLGLRKMTEFVIFLYHDYIVFITHVTPLIKVAALYGVSDDRIFAAYKGTVSSLSLACESDTHISIII